MRKLTEAETKRTRDLIASDLWVKSLYNNLVYRGSTDIDTALYTIAKNFCIVKDSKAKS